jgi:ATP-dependent Lon protease
VANSIANAMNREFVRISLGGVRDEAELRGHRRTYVGSMPGRIISAVHKAKYKNPVILLDEIDKMSTDFRGDPSAALMEILDPEQNKTFSDHYLEVPFDLSDVIFIGTANSLEPIPKPLLDRMEIIELNGYTEEEKIEIAKQYLIPKQLEKNGLNKKQVKFIDEGLRLIIREYTKEVGLREIERAIASICRKSAKIILEKGKSVVKINKPRVKKFLGPRIYKQEKIEEKNPVGVVNGLAWTQYGGDALPVEVSILKGKGSLMLTGKLGEVMKESAQAAMSYIRSRTKELELDEDFYRRKDIHVHVPEGAIPKDGPSAGITIATALASALSNIPVRRDVAMTGEITLRGRVLPIGGLKEKSLAAYMMGVKMIIIPKDNEKDLPEIPKKIRKKIKFVLAEHMDDVLKAALAKFSIKKIKTNKDKAIDENDINTEKEDDNTNNSSEELNSDL